MITLLSNYSIDLPFIQNNIAVCFCVDCTSLWIPKHIKLSFAFSHTAKDFDFLFYATVELNQLVLKENYSILQIYLLTPSKKKNHILTEIFLIKFLMKLIYNNNNNYKHLTNLKNNQKKIILELILCRKYLKIILMKT